jgi:hypothetical protein
VQQGLAPDDKWDFLDDGPDDAPPPDTGDALEDESKDTSEKPSETSGPSETPETPETPKTIASAGKEISKESAQVAEQVPALSSDVQKNLNAFPVFDEALQERPGELIQHIFADMDVRDRAALLKSLGAETPLDNFDIMSYEPQGDMEAALALRWPDIEAIPQVNSEVRQLANSLGADQGKLEPHIGEANVSAQIALAKIDAIVEALGLDLPEPDIKAIQAALKDGRSTYRSAVRGAVNYGKSIEAAKQVRMERPRTPGTSSRVPDTFKPGTSMVEIARRLGRL